MTRWTAEDIDRLRNRQMLSELFPKGARHKTPKYLNKPVRIDGKRFASKLESRCYEWLKLRQVWREVPWFIRQPRFELEGGVVYVADFLAVLATGGVEVIDAKGRLTPGCKNKLRQVKARYGFDVKLWTDKPTLRLMSEK